MSFHSPVALSGLAAFILFASMQSGLADAIDGDWCHSDGKRMSIRGAEIVTPGGKRTQGDYTRHSFSYIVPSGEAGAGDSVQIVLRGAYLAQAQQGAENSPWQEWRRCPATTS